MMVDKPAGSEGPGLEERAPREVDARPVAQRPDERTLDTVSCIHTIPSGELTTERAERPGVWPPERLLDFDVARIEGWVAGVPVVDGVADSGWMDCKDGRVRLVVRIKDSPDQREWVRAMALGVAYAKEVLS